MNATFAAFTPVIWFLLALAFLFGYYLLSVDAYTSPAGEQITELGQRKLNRLEAA